MIKKARYETRHFYELLHRTLAYSSKVAPQQRLFTLQPDKIKVNLLQDYFATVNF